MNKDHIKRCTIDDFDDDERWMPSSIMIPASNGDPPLNVMDIFCIPDNDYVPQQPDLEFPSMHLPPDIYPPTQDSWKKVSDIIIRAAADQGNTLLIRN